LAQVGQRIPEDPSEREESKMSQSMQIKNEIYHPRQDYLDGQPSVIEEMSREQLETSQFHKNKDQYPTQLEQVSLSENINQELPVKSKRKAKTIR